MALESFTRILAVRMFEILPKPLPPAFYKRFQQDKTFCVKEFYCCCVVLRLRALPMEYLEFPAQSVRCRISGLAPPDGQNSWEPSTTAAMLQLLSDRIHLAVFHVGTCRV